MSGAPSPPAGVRASFALARLTTVKTGGAAEWFARAGSEGELGELLAWAGARALAVNVIGSGSNVLVADGGVPGLVLKLDRELAKIAVEGRRMLCGGGARLPAVASAAARAGLSGIEFGVNIPGTVGGAVRMNANAYGGQLGRVLEWVRIVTAAGAERREPGALGLAYRHSNLASGEIVASASLLLAPAEPGAVKASLADMRRRRHEAQPQGIRTFGSTFKNPDDPAAEGRSAGAAAVGGGLQRPGGRRRALRAQARELHREHRRRHHRGGGRRDGRGPPAGSGALWRGARARGADTRRRALPLVDPVAEVRRVAGAVAPVTEVGGLPARLLR